MVKSTDNVMTEITLGIKNTRAEGDDAAIDINFSKWLHTLRGINISRETGLPLRLVNALPKSGTVNGVGVVRDRGDASLKQPGISDVTRINITTDANNPDALIELFNAAGIINIDPRTYERRDPFAGVATVIPPPPPSIPDGEVFALMLERIIDGDPSELGAFFFLHEMRSDPSLDDMAPDKGAVRLFVTYNRQNDDYTMRLWTAHNKEFFGTSIATLTDAARLERFTNSISMHVDETEKHDETNIYITGKREALVDYLFAAEILPHKLDSDTLAPPILDQTPCLPIARIAAPPTAYTEKLLPDPDAAAKDTFPKRF